MNATNPSYCWDALPDLVLSNVFQHLDELEDRYSASQVCRNWASSFKFPELWRRMEIKVSSANVFDRRRLPYKFATSSVGVHLRDLEIDFCEGDHLSERTFLDFLEILMQRQINLKSIIFIDLHMVTWGHCCCAKDDEDMKTIISLAISRFLETQSNLVHFDMKDCDTTVSIGVGLLSQLAKNNSKDLKNLHLRHFFEPDSETLLSNPDYHKAMSSFRSLAELHVNYMYIDENLLTSIVTNCSSCLKVIDILFYNFGKQDHVISNATWTKVRKTCPQLQVRFLVSKNSCLFSRYSHAIPPKMGLNYFKVLVRDYSGSKRNMEINELMLHLSTYFWDTLVSLRLDIDQGLKFDEQLLIGLVSSCSELKNFSFSGTCSVQTAKTLYDTLCDIVDKNKGASQIVGSFSKSHLKRKVNISLSQLDRFDNELQVDNYLNLNWPSEDENEFY